MSGKSRQITIKYVICGCGCKVEKPEMKRCRVMYRAPETGSKCYTTQMRCPKHHKENNSGIVDYISVCADCGKETAGLVRRCPKHAAIFLKERTKKAQEKYFQSPKGKINRAKATEKWKTKKEGKTDIPKIKFVRSFCRELCGKVCIIQYFECEYDPDKKLKREDVAV